MFCHLVAMIDAPAPGSSLAGEQLRVFPSPLLKFAVLCEAKEYFSCDLTLSTFCLLSPSPRSRSTWRKHWPHSRWTERLGRHSGLSPVAKEGWQCWSPSLTSALNCLKPNAMTQTWPLWASFPHGYVSVGTLLYGFSSALGSTKHRDCKILGFQLDTAPFDLLAT